jgi:hypothetical protein
MRVGAPEGGVSGGPEVGAGPSTVGEENAEKPEEDDAGPSTVGDENAEKLDMDGSSTGRGRRTGSGVAPPSAGDATR